jgi:hypothetical protein
MSDLKGNDDALPIPGAYVLSNGDLGAFDIGAEVQGILAKSIEARRWPIGRATHQMHVRIISPNDLYEQSADIGKHGLSFCKHQPDASGMTD